jgi:hypothetical protein
MTAFDFLMWVGIAVVAGASGYIGYLAGKQVGAKSKVTTK